MKEREPRYRRLRVTAKVIMTLLARWKKSNAIALPVFRDVPEDVEVRGVEFCLAHNAFLLLIWHPSFDLVPDWQESPLMISEVEIVSLKDKVQIREGTVLYAGDPPSRVGTATADLQQEDRSSSMAKTVTLDAAGKPTFDRVAFDGPVRAGDFVAVRRLVPENGQMVIISDEDLNVFGDGVRTVAEIAEPVLKARALREKAMGTAFVLRDLADAAGEMAAKGEIEIPPATEVEKKKKVGWEFLGPPL
jgi:hypothetical protein